MNSKVVVALLAVAGPLGAQAVVRGAVMTEQGQLIAGVELQVAALNRSVRTDSTGHYRMLLPPGRYRLTTRAIGFLSQSDSIQPEANVELVLNFRLASVATVLDTVTTTVGAEDYRSSGLLGFEERRKRGQGRYISEAEFEKNSNRLLADFLRRVSGLQVKTGRGGQAYAAAQRALTGRGDCLVAVFLDGLAIYNGQRGEFPVDLNMLSPGTLAGAEFYASSGTSPAQFRDKTGCGTLLLWTRER